MKLPQAKLFFTFFVLLAYTSIGVFGLMQFTHANEMPMINCPYAENGFAVCDSAIDHINNWQQFSNAIIPSLSVFLLLTLCVVLHFFLKRRDFLNHDQFWYKFKYHSYDKALHNPLQEIIKWLSLFENSPSFSYKA